MTEPAFAFCVLPDRGVIAVDGADAVAFLDALITNAVDGLSVSEARFSGLLTPQGKIQFEFFVQRTETGFLLDTSRGAAAGLCQRLTLYKLRAKVTITDRSDALAVAISPQPVAPSLGRSFADPRDAALGFRVVSADPSFRGRHDLTELARYHALRIALGVPEGGLDYALGDTFPHEANYDLLNGASFSKGCYVGQEVVSRMQNKTVVRKRVVGVTGVDAVSADSAILLGTAEIGHVGSVAGRHGLALLRLDRAAEAAAKGEVLHVGGNPITVDPAALARYVKSVADKPVIDL